MNRAAGICTGLAVSLLASLVGAAGYAQGAEYPAGEVLPPAGAGVTGELAQAVQEQALGQVIADLQADERALRQAIAALEASDGAYAPGLAQPLLSLGLALQTQDRHAEAVQLFRRGAHLARRASSRCAGEKRVVSTPRGHSRSRSTPMPSRSE